MIIFNNWLLGNSMPYSINQRVNVPGYGPVSNVINWGGNDQPNNDMSYMNPWMSLFGGGFGNLFSSLFSRLFGSSFGGGLSWDDSNNYDYSDDASDCGCGTEYDWTQPEPMPEPAPECPPVIYGTPQNETFTLTCGDQTLYAAAGNDTVNVKSSGNTIYGQNGRDYVYFFGNAKDNVYVNDGTSPMSDEVFFSNGAHNNIARNYDASGLLGPVNGTGTAVFEGQERDYIVYRDWNGKGDNYIKVVHRMDNGEPDDQRVNFLEGYSNVYFSKV